MENKVLSKEEFCKKIIPQNPNLLFFTSGQIKLEYETFKLDKLLNGIFYHCVPTEEIEIQLNKKKINITMYIYNNLMFSINLLSTTLHNNDIITALKDSFYELYKESFKEFYDKNRNMIIWNDHDKYLKTFEISLKKHLNILYSYGSMQAQSLFLFYARTIFEKRQFQAPMRLSFEEAEKDAKGLSNLWKEYLDKWDIQKLLLHEQ
jgi:hypothetical protein